MSMAASCDLEHGPGRCLDCDRSQRYLGHLNGTRECSSQGMRSFSEAPASLLWTWASPYQVSPKRVSGYRNRR